MTPFASYLLSAIVSWMPGVPVSSGCWHCGLPVYMTDTEYLEQQAAADIDDVLADPDEPPLWHNRPKTGLLLAGLAKLEGGFVPFVVDGRCNDPEWRKSPEGKKTMAPFGGDSVCDSGHAFSGWQIHADEGGGLVLIPRQGYMSAIYYDRLPPVEGAILVHGIDLIRDPKLAARTALHIVRQSLHDHGDLRGYTGEPLIAHPKATTRENMAIRYLAKHPFEQAAPDPAVVVEVVVAGSGAVATGQVATGQAPLLE